MASVPRLQTPARILFFHQGFSPYLPFALAQARASNPRARVILLGDAANQIHGLGHEHQGCPENSPRRLRFHRAFVHLNTSNLEDERRCIERWLCLADFLEKEPAGPFWFLDSDAFVMADLESLTPILAGQTAGLPHLYGSCFCPDKNLVIRLAEWILQQYEDPACLRSWTEKFLKFRQGDPGGAVVHDMALIIEFERQQNLQLRDLRKPIGSWLVDGGQLGGAFLQNKTTVPRLRRNPPDGEIRVRLKSGEYRMAVVHLQGYDKSHAAGLTAWRPAIVRSFLRSPFRRNLKNLCRYWWNGERYRRYLDAAGSSA